MSKLSSTNIPKISNIISYITINNKSFNFFFIILLSIVCTCVEKKSILFYSILFYK